MTRSVLLSAALFLSFPLFSTAQTQGLDSLLDLAPAGPQEAAFALPEGAEKKWGISYVLDGALRIEGEKVLLNTSDGRLFELDLSRRKARKFEGKTVRVEAKAKQADDLSLLKVEGIAEHKPAPGDFKLPPYQPKRRRAHLLADAGAALTVENVRWLYSAKPEADSFDWATAVIKPELVKNVYFVKKPFAPEWIAAHSLLMFSFEKGGLTDASGNEASGLVLTVEAFLREGQTYDLKEGLKNKFGIVWMLTTWEDYSARTVLNASGDNRLVPYQVTGLSRAQMAAAVREGLRLADVNRDGEFYHTLTNNCTNNLLVVLNRVLPENRRIRMWTIPYLLYNVRATMPVWVPPYLQKKGLLGPELPVINASTYQQAAQLN